MKRDNIEAKFDILIEAIRKVATPIPAIPSIPSIPAIPAIPPLQQYTGDHDLLQRLDIKVDALTLAVKDLSEREDTHITKREFSDHILVEDDHEKRIRVLEINIAKIMTWGTAMVLLLGIAEFLINKFLTR